MSLLLILSLPLVGAALVVVAGARAGLRAAAVVAPAVLTCASVVWLAASFDAGNPPEVQFGSLARDLDLVLRVDHAGLLFALVASGLWVAASVYSLGYLAGAGEANRTRFLAAFALCVATAIGLAFSANLITFFLFYELLTLATYPLVVHKQSPAAMAAGRRYLGTLLAGGVAVLLVVALVHGAAPGADFTAGGVLDGRASDAKVVAIAALAALGFATKAAVMPFHQWLPSAMVAPTPVSALLHAVAVVKAGVFGFVRVFGYVVGPERLAEVGVGVVVASVAAVTIVVASVIALQQDNLKRRLAYSTIAHLSYIVLGVSLLSPDAWNGALLHIANHAVLKITLFFCAGALYVTAGVERVSQLDGIGRRMPFTMAAFGVAALGLAGLPPVGGFVSKWFLGAGAIDAGQPVLAIVVLGSGLLTAAYLLPIVHRAFFRHSDQYPVRDEAAPSLLVPLVATASVGLLFGLGDVAGFGELARTASVAVTGGAS
jgi:multicomponent Na+:H+ antiporter subunit D